MQHEGQALSKTDLRKVQDHQAQGPRDGHMREPEAQTKAGLTAVYSVC
jgi:hypothetical protein